MVDSNSKQCRMTFLTYSKLASNGDWAAVSEHDGRLSSRGNIVDRGEAEVDNAFRGVTIYHVFRKESNIYFIISNVPISYTTSI